MADCYWSIHGEGVTTMISDPDWDIGYAHDYLDHWDISGCT